jgi:hypothetical protein
MQNPLGAPHSEDPDASFSISQTSANRQPLRSPSARSTSVPLGAASGQDIMALSLSGPADMVEVVHNYAPNASFRGYLTLISGEILTDITQQERGWGRGTNAVGQTGLFPIACVQSAAHVVQGMYDSLGRSQ